MTKAELIEAVASKAGGSLTKNAAAELVDAVFSTIAVSVKKEKRFSYPGFGTWTVRQRKARKGRNPQTGAQITIKASKTVGFRPAKELKGSL
jgi:DNA-binding protein HU-beta